MPTPLHSRTTTKPPPPPTTHPTATTTTTTTTTTITSEDEIWSLFYQICLGVHHLHTNGIIHRDIKTLNIMLSKDMRTAKLADLGVSRQVSQVSR